MKSITGYSLLFIYITLLVLPCLPLLKDTIAHQYYQKEHLLTVHQKHGHSHTHTEMAYQNDGSAKDAKSQTSESFEFSLQLIPENFRFTCIKGTVSTFSTTTFFLTCGAISSLLQPPG